MRAGLLREVITVQGITETKNGFGAITQSWVDKFSIRAQVFATGNREVQNSEIFNNYTLTFTVRVFPVITEKDRLIYDGKKYRILSIVKNITLQSRIIIGELINE